MPRVHDRRRHYLLFSGWPEQDRIAWRALFCPGSALDEGGTCAHWASASIRKRVNTYGHWLTFLSLFRPQTMGWSPEARITPEAIAAYRAELDQLVAPRTMQMRLVDMLCIAVGLDPDHDWGFLRDLTNALHRTALPVRDKPARVVHSARLFELGMELIARCQGITGDGIRNRIHRAVLMRDGLVIALLAARPLRKRNLAELEVGRTFLDQGSRFRIAIPASETKNHRPIDFDVPEVLTGSFSDYLDTHLQVLRRGTQLSALWITHCGDAMTGHGLYVMVAYRTRKAFGHSVNLHLFRDAAATSLAIDDPDHVRVATTLLGHASLATTARHYNQARMLAAAQAMQAHVHRLRRQVMAERPKLRHRGAADTFPRDGEH